MMKERKFTVRSSFRRRTNLLKARFGQPRARYAQQTQMVRWQCTLQASLAALLATQSLHQQIFSRQCQRDVARAVKQQNFVICWRERFLESWDDITKKDLKSSSSTRTKWERWLILKWTKCYQLTLARSSPLSLSSFLPQVRFRPSLTPWRWSYFVIATIRGNRLFSS